MTFVRYGLPALLFIAGFVVLIVAGKANAVEGWAMLVGAAVALLLFNMLFRIGFTGDAERQDEEDARTFLKTHGHWPDEPPPAPR